MSHTKGPWKVRLNGYDVINKDIFIVACDNVALSDSECKANTRLIAAAPEMLELLEEVYQNWNPPEIETGIGMFPDSEKFNKLFNIIKKAKGG